MSILFGPAASTDTEGLERRAFGNLDLAVYSEFFQNGGTSHLTAVVASIINKKPLEMVHRLTGPRKHGHKGPWKLRVRRVGDAMVYERERMTSPPTTDYVFKFENGAFEVSKVAMYPSSGGYEYDLMCLDAKYLTFTLYGDNLATGHWFDFSDPILSPTFYHTISQLHPHSPWASRPSEGRIQFDREDVRTDYEVVHRYHDLDSFKPEQSEEQGTFDAERARIIRKEIPGALAFNKMSRGV